ncbi:clathrin adaptor, mu subunit [Basidiobolus meristosporus CBS 931.73]|uniref:Clathrin adaptor, mu subunit n=1 Tax=Basidiobolus meristosporus CBS 931.73 TaxID=1314790 RepID=A0A1Y1YD38_9FUNG|nr:clathrin adaptor, mu subunit [Basidiobolus meristosporus CBS 931.73]|eukprot:ORX95909.1 clathrin adaptor, mu subunit [Basidiobolus meristosporus CBS 931.73]
MLNGIISGVNELGGGFGETLIRRNLGLVYEILDEVVVAGVPVSTDVEFLREVIYNEPDAEWKSSIERKPLKQRTESIITHEQKLISRSEVFVDLLETVTGTFNPSGEALRSEIEGSLIMKSFLKGDPELQVQLSGNFSILNEEGHKTSYETVILDQLNFHERVDTTDFSNHRTLKIEPKDGEITLMKYRIEDNTRLPFRIFTCFDDFPEDDRATEVVVRIRADFPGHVTAQACSLSFSLPKYTLSASNTITPDTAADEKASFDFDSKTINWTIPKFVGCTEKTLHTKVLLEHAIDRSNEFEEMGQVDVRFQIANWTSSGIGIAKLKVFDRTCTHNAPKKWVRHLTASENYSQRF